MTDEIVGKILERLKEHTDGIVAWDKQSIHVLSELKAGREERHELRRDIAKIYTELAVLKAEKKVVTGVTSFLGGAVAALIIGWILAVMNG